VIFKVTLLQICFGSERMLSIRIRQYLVKLRSYEIWWLTFLWMVHFLYSVILTCSYSFAGVFTVMYVFTVLYLGPVLIYLYSCRVATNLEILEYSGISLNMENSGNSQEKNCNKQSFFLVCHSNIWSECGGDRLYCWSLRGMTLDKGHYYIYLLLR